MGGQKNAQLKLDSFKIKYIYIKSGMENLSSKIVVCTMCFPGKTVLIVNGIHRGSTAALVSLDEKSFSVTVDLKDVSKASAMFV